MLSPTSVYDAFYPFGYVTKLFALNKIGKTTTQQTYTTATWAKYIFVGNMLVVAATSTLYFFCTSFADDEEASDVYYWSLRIYNWAAFGRFTFIHIMRLYHHRREMALFATIDDFDRELTALGKSRAIAYANRLVAIYAIAAIPASIVVYALSEVYTTAIGDTDIHMTTIIARFAASYVGILAKIQFYMWCTAIKERFAMINDLLTKVKERFHVNNMFVVSVYKYEQCLEKYGDKHRELTQMARVMNDMYQFDMLWHFLIMFVVIFTNGYYSTFNMLRSNGEFNYMAIVSNFLFVSFEIILSIKSSTDLCNESYRSLDIFNNLKVDPDDRSTQRLVISSIFELKENRLEITACRFFNVNFSTLAVMITIITNYIFILIQFEDSSTSSAPGANITTMATMATTSVTALTAINQS